MRENAEQLLGNSKIQVLIVSLIFTLVLGESFKFISAQPVGLPIIFFIFLFVWSIFKYRRIIYNNIVVYLVALLACGLFSGLMNENFLYFVAQDSLVVLVLIFSAAMWPNGRPLMSIRKILLTCRIGGLIVLLKVTAILLLNLDPSWDDSILAAKNFYQGNGVPRVSLKSVGPALYFLVALEVLLVLVRSSFRSLPFLCLFLALAVFDGSRALLATVGLAIFIVCLLDRRTSRLIRAFTVVSITLFSIGIASSSFRSDGNQIDGKYAEAGFSSNSVGYRIIESLSAVDTVKNRLLGEGLGASFLVENSGAASDNNRGNFVHSIPIWVYLKFGLFGVFGLALFFLWEIRMMLKGHLESKNGSRSRLIFSTFLFCMLLGSCVSNMISTFAGALTMAILFAGVRETSTLNNRYTLQPN